ncbi:MAG: TIGR03790 family protein, partial [Candidatus Solibacter sp.]|nr:TIGR03790 family protein [Candidatus Solibacter sp.]
MRLLYALILAAAAFPQSVPLKDRVLILVNDRVPESVSVGQYYAARRNIPTANILRLKTLATEQISREEYQEQIENPVRKFLDANGGAMRKKILYIVPTYGVPLKIAQQFAVDSVLAAMYAGHEDLKPPLRNPYSAPTGSRPPHFAEW